MPASLMSTFQERLQTFEEAHAVKRRGSTAKKRGPAATNWPHKTPTGHDLAQAGFYYHPGPSSLDNVRCFSCDVNLDGWESEDEPILEHYAHRSDCAWGTCRFVKHKFEKKEPIPEDPMSDIYANARRATFEGWPHESKRGWKCKIDKMVEAGWHFDPSQDMEDGVTCSYCSTELGGWERKDDPFEEHLKRGTDCPFFALCDQFASSRPTKAKRARMSKTARLSTQSEVSAWADPLSSTKSLADSDKTANSGRETMLSSAPQPAKGGQRKRRTTARNTKWKAVDNAALDENVIVELEATNADLAASKKPQPVKKSGIKKNAVEDDSEPDRSDLAASSIVPVPKARSRKKPAEPRQDMEQEDLQQSHQTRRKASHQLATSRDAETGTQLQVMSPQAVGDKNESVKACILNSAVSPDITYGKGRSEVRHSGSTQPAKVKRPVKSKQSRGTKRTSDGNIKCPAPQIQMSFLDKLDSSVMVFDDVPLISEDAPKESATSSKRQSSVRQPLQELRPEAVESMSESSILRSSNMHEADSSTPRVTPEPASANNSPEAPTPTPVRQSLSVVKRASMMREGVRPSATPLPSLKEKNSLRTVKSASPQSSDAENQPPSVRPEKRAMQLDTLSPLKLGIAKTPFESPSKRLDTVSRVQSDCRWSPANVELVFQPYSLAQDALQAHDKENFLPDNMNLDMNELNAETLELTIKSVRQAMTNGQRKMTVEQWLNYSGQLASNKLKAECEIMVTLFEREGAKAMRCLEAIRTSR